MERVAPHQRTSTTSVVRQLFNTPYEFSFLQAVRLFQKLLPNTTDIGSTLHPSNDMILFSSRYTYSLPSSDIYRIQLLHDKPLIEVNFWNLSGPHGALPAPLSEKIMDNIRSGNAALKDFMDIFNHRLLSIYYRIAEKYSFVLSPKNSTETITGHMLRSVSGLCVNQSTFFSVPTEVLTQYAGILWQRPRSAAGLEQLLSDYFQVPITIEQCVGSWVDIDRRQRSFMGKRRGRNHRLGQNTFLGKRFWQSAHHFIVHVGPLTAQQFHNFIPTGNAYGQLCDIIKFYAPAELTFQLKMGLKEKETLVAAGFDNAPKDNRLGWTAILKQSPTDYAITISAA